MMRSFKLDKEAVEAVVLLAGRVVEEARARADAEGETRVGS